MTRLALKIAAGLVLVLLLAVGASAALDRPARTATVETEIDAPRELVWDVLMDFSTYGEWNPYMPSVEGTVGKGETLRVHIVPPGGPERDVDAEVFVFKPPRKLRWQSRMLMPGLRDLEYEVIVAPLGPNRAQVTQRARHEGLLILLTDTGSTKAGLESMAAALEQRVQDVG